ncbi:hypothetical protein MKW94_022301 [Papaver nudicaule]|uniref:Uncharacterized protein n=1 Tax=Papaver nudicaule TaxID=74823 RepID=A0AA41VZN4_PAPNU|nr:hypothetical protein [Papaver nudicaule]
MESLTRRTTRPAIFLFLFLFISLNLSATINSAPNANEPINSHLRKLLGRPGAALTPPPKANPSKHFEVPPAPPPPPDNGT